MRVRQLGDPILRKVSQPILPDDIIGPKTEQIIAVMVSILDGLKTISDENGNAISAPQIGHAVRLIVLRLAGEFVVMINPIFSYLSTQTFAFQEECFSFYHLRGEVDRHHQVTVEYCDEHGQQQSLDLKGDDAALAQHEADHLDGVLFIDRISSTDKLASIDHMLKDTPQHLQTAKQLMNYMVG